jgi:hypothetical protein
LGFSVRGNVSFSRKKEVMVLGPVLLLVLGDRVLLLIRRLG